MDTTILSTSEQQTREVASELMKKYMMQVPENPVIFLLYGNLGAGKTVFVKGIGDALGVSDIVSPSFTIYDECDVHHDGIEYLYHFDLFRITEVEEFEHLGLTDIVKPGNVLAIEWSEKSDPIKDILLRNKSITVCVRMEHFDREKRRIIIKDDCL